MLKKYRIVILLILLVLMASCSEEKEIKRVNDFPIFHQALNMKKQISTEFFNSATVQKFEVDFKNFYSFLEWYDDNQVLFSSDYYGESILEKYNTHEGTVEHFFESSGYIVNVEANGDFSLFAIEQRDRMHNTILSIVDRKGHVKYEWKALTDHIEYIWNPYIKGELFFANVSSDWDVQTYLWNMDTNTTKTLDIKTTYIQWTSERSFAYLKWGDSQPGYDAPLYTYSLETEEETKWLDYIIAFFSFEGIFMTISIENLQDSYSTYTFYSMDTMDKLAFVKVPIINMYSEQWWIPFHDFDAANKTFFYLRPYNSADTFQYNDGFQLVAFSLHSGKQEVIADLKGNDPLKLSPDTNHMITGRFMSLLINRVTKQKYELLPSY